VTICAHDVCADGAADIARARDDQALAIALTKALDIAAGEKFTITFRKIGGDKYIAVWLYNPSPGTNSVRPKAWLPKLSFMPDPEMLPVHQGPTMAVFEIPGVRNYFSAAGCEVTALSRNRVDAVCKKPSTLVRLELYMRGWNARINGDVADIGLEDDTFQTVALPAGNSQVVFSYWPPGFTFALTAAIAAMVGILSVCGPIFSKLGWLGRRTPEQTTHLM
jgi:hypothetical protein